MTNKDYKRTYELIALVKEKILTQKTSLDRVFARYFNEDRGAYRGGVNGEKLGRYTLIHINKSNNPKKFYAEIEKAGYKIIDTKLKEQKLK